MAAGRRGEAVEETFVVVSLAVAIEVMQTGDLIAPEDVHFAVDDFDTQGLMQAGRIPPPDGLVARQAPDQPDLTGHGGDRRSSIRQEVDPADEE